MNPQDIFCPNMDCPARGQKGKGNIRVHSPKEERWICEVCQKTFTSSKGTIFYRLRTDPQIVMWAIILLAYGCPVQAIVKAFELDERTASSRSERPYEIGMREQEPIASKCMNNWLRAVSRI